MAFPQGVYFRATDNQTDPTNYDAEVATTANYPRTTAQGNTVGWEATLGVSTRDRTGPTDVRLKGVHFAGNNAGTSDYRIDLPATGNYNIRLAMGDQAAAQACRVQFFDTSTQFANIDANVSAAHWLDATGVDRAGESAWVNSNAALAQAFASTIFRAKFGLSVNTASSNWTVAALYIEAAAGGGTTLTPADASHAHSAESATLAQNHVLSPADAAHAHAADNASLAQTHLLAVADALHGHTADAATLSQVHSLAVDDAAHAHTAESVTLDLSVQIVPADARHGHTAENTTLAQVHALVAASAIHAHTAEVATLAQVHVLAPADASHAHTAESARLVEEGETSGAALTIADARVTTITISDAARYAVTVSDALLYP